MPFSFDYQPYMAIAGASRVIGMSQRQREEEERLRKQMLEDETRELKRAQIVSGLQQQATDNDFRNRQLASGDWRFQANLQSDQQGRQNNIYANLQSRAQGEAGDLARQRYVSNTQQQMHRDKMLADMAEREMMGQQQQDNQQALTDRQMQYGALRGDIQLYNRLATAEIDPMIMQGLNAGSLKHSEWQLAERSKLSKSIDDARGDPKLTAAERARFMAQQQQRINEIDNNPQTVPPGERPVPLDQQFSQETTEIPGLPGRYQRSMRNGVASWSPVETPKDPALEQQQDIELKQVQADQQLDIDTRKAQREAINDFRDASIKRIEDRQKLVIKLLDAQEPDQGLYMTGAPKAEGGQATLDIKSYNSAREKWLEKKIAKLDEFDAKLNELAGRHDQEDSSMNPVPQSEPTAVQSPDELAALIRGGQLQVGDTVMTPAGPRPITEEVYRKLMGD